MRAERHLMNSTSFLPGGRFMGSGNSESFGGFLFFFFPFCGRFLFFLLRLFSRSSLDVHLLQVVSPGHMQPGVLGGLWNEVHSTEALNPEGLDLT